MSKSLLVGGKHLILPNWQVLAVCGGLDFEAGGTMKLDVFFDPQLGPEPQIIEPSADEYRKYASGPEEVELLMKGAHPRVRLSHEARQVLALSFGSRDHSPHFDWELHQKRDDLIQRAGTAVTTMGRPRESSIAFLRELLAEIGILDDWAEVNTSRFSNYRIVIEADLATAIALPGASPAAVSNGLVAIFCGRTL